MLVLAVVGEGRAGRAVLLEALRAVVAGAAAVDEAADRGEVASLELRDARADSRDAAEDLVARHDRILREAPLVSGEVEIAVADAAEEDVDLDIACGRLAALDRVRGEGRGGRLGGVGAGGHAVSFEGAANRSLAGCGG